jgi:hypothetical protein
MKSYDSRTYSINDFVEWDKAGQLELNPRFQRRPVWTDKAKSFLMDTILRGEGRLTARLPNAHRTG